MKTILLLKAKKLQEFLGCRIFFGFLVFSLGCQTKIASKSHADKSIHSWFVEEHEDDGKWYYIPVRKIISPGLEAFARTTPDITRVSSDGHAGAGYFAQIVVTKGQNTSAILWRFSNVGEVILEEELVSGEDRFGRMVFYVPEERLGKSPTFVRSPTLSDLVKDLKGKTKTST